MRLLVLSDLHLESITDPSRATEDGIPVDPRELDAVVLAGDISNGIAGLQWAQKRFGNLPLFYVAGNHEPYFASVAETNEKLARAAATGTDTRFLQMADSYLDGVRILGTTLWTDFALYGHDKIQASKSLAHRGISDYRLIKQYANARSQLRLSITPEITLRWHEEQRAWLEEELAKPFAGKTVVITHMGPSPRSIAPRYLGNQLNPAFVSKLDHLFSHADLWIHGHTHASCDYQAGRCRVVCNPRGYWNWHDGSWENPNFDPNFVVDV
jgi:predicted phosphodiesterase